MNRFAAAGLCAALLLVPASARPAGAPTGADLLPETTAFYAEVPAPGRLSSAQLPPMFCKRCFMLDKPWPPWISAG